MKDCKSNRNCIFTIIGVLVVLISAAALIFVYRNRICNFFAKAKNFLTDLKDNFLSDSAVSIEGYDFCDEYEDFADI